MSFNLFDHPIVFSTVKWLSSASAWLEHTPFAMLLTDLARPKVFVELGTHAGVSYCAFCQAVEELALTTRCFAIDTWQGDAHTREYPDHVLQNLRGYHDPLYASFSTLLKKTFDEALGDFADGSIDLLHIDGLHTYEAVKHDFESWLPKMSDAGIMLFHDTAERREDFGVYRLWEEISPHYPSYEFKHGHGLGILAVGKNPPALALDFITDANARREVYGRAFMALGSRDLLKPTLSGVMGILYQQQLVVNRWKREDGKEISPASEDLKMALMNPYGYVRNAAKDALDMIRASRHRNRTQ